MIRLLAVLIGWLLVTASLVAVAQSLPDVPDEVEVRHRIVVELPPLEVDASVKVDPGQLNFGRVRVDVPVRP